MPGNIGSIIDAKSERVSSPTSPDSTGSGIKDSINGSDRPDNIIYGYDAIDPRTIGVESIGGTGADSDFGARRRGRPRGSKNRTGTGTDSEAEETIHKGLADLTGILLTGHMMLAALTAVKEFELEKKEAQDLSDAIKQVLKFHPIGLNPKYFAYANLAFICATVYGTRMLAFSIRKDTEKASKPKVVAIKTPPASNQSKVNGLAASQTTEGIYTPADIWHEPASDDIP
jgi:hypothetical protein